jgi:hypothetical protein
MKKRLLAIFLLSLFSGDTLAQAQSPEERLKQSRAVEAVIWGMPAVNFELLYQGMVDSKGTWNQIVYWSRLPDWKNQTLTPNPGTVYLHPFYNTKDGPIVLEIPPADGGSFVGSIDDAWQTALEDVGPAGVDKGKGGKYLILPPGYSGKSPDGYIALPSSTYTGFVVLRSSLKSTGDADVADAVSYGKRAKMYPLSQAANPPRTVFVDAIDVVYDNTIPYDLRFFQMLDRFIQREPWLERDKAMIEQLKSIGIEKGKPFKPDDNTQKILASAARDARAVIDVKYEALFSPPYYPGTHWSLPVSQELVEGIASNFTKPDSYPVDERGALYSFAFFSAKHLGAGQFYLMTIRDKEGQPYDGSSTYRLRVPANAPVKLYWSATVYDRSSHAFIRGMTISSRSSLDPNLKKNTDGSVDVFFGPQAPDGKDSNWVPTKANGQFEVLFRFYGPEKPLFDKSWVMTDIEKVKQ